MSINYVITYDLSSAGVLEQLLAYTDAYMKHIVIDARIRPASTGRPVDRLLDRLQKLDHKNRYTVILKSDDAWQPSANNFMAVHTRVPIFSFNILNQLHYSWHIRSLKPDLVYFTLTPQQPLLYRGPFITLTHDLGMLTYARPGRLPGWLHAIRMWGYRLLLWDAHKRARQIVTPTQFVADDVNKFHLVTNRKTTVIWQACDTPDSSHVAAPKRRPKEFIMYVGSSFPHKNLDNLISAYHLLRQQHPKLTLVLVGKKEKYKQALEQWAHEHDLQDGVLFLDFIPDAEVAWYYQNARAYVFASLSEGFGLPGLEAMAHGCPVVSSNASCLPEVHGDAAHEFDPTDIHDMAAKIDEVISDDVLRNTLIQKGHKNTRRFSWDTFARKHIELFNDTLK